MQPNYFSLWRRPWSCPPMYSSLRPNTHLKQFTFGHGTKGCPAQALSSFSVMRWSVPLTDISLLTTDFIQIWTFKSGLCSIFYRKEIDRWTSSNTWHIKAALMVSETLRKERYQDTGKGWTGVNQEGSPWTERSMLPRHRALDLSTGQCHAAPGHPVSTTVTWS